MKAKQPPGPPMTLGRPGPPMTLGYMREQGVRFFWPSA
jgi:hypothetical protein